MIRIEYKDIHDKKAILRLNQGIAQHAQVMKGQKPIEFFSFFLKEENDEVMGGCAGVMYYGCLYIDQLWVDECIRGQGYGIKLVSMAEELAKEKNCKFSTVNTMDWEALDFYKKLGYLIEFERHGYEKNSIFYFLRKDLSHVQL